MGQFSSGVWILGISIYFFVFGLIMFAVMSSNSFYGIDNTGLSYSGNSYLNLENTKTNNSCSGNINYLSCSYNNINDNASCSLVNGCDWVVGGIFGNTCDGIITYSSCLGLNETVCNLVSGCSFVSNSENNVYFNYEDGLSWSNMKLVLSTMMGFNANIGSPVSIGYLLSFFLFWIPFFMFVWSIYMSIPFLH